MLLCSVAGFVCLFVGVPRSLVVGLVMSVALSLFGVLPFANEKLPHTLAIPSFCPPVFHPDPLASRWDFPLFAPKRSTPF